MTKLCLVTRTIAENSVIDRWIVQMWKHPGHLILKKNVFSKLVHLRAYVYVFSIVAKASTFDFFIEFVLSPSSRNRSYLMIDRENLPFILLCHK